MRFDGVAADHYMALGTNALCHKNLSSKDLSCKDRLQQ